MKLDEMRLEASLERIVVPSFTALRKETTIWSLRPLRVQLLLAQGKAHRACLSGDHTSHRNSHRVQFSWERTNSSTLL